MRMKPYKALALDRGTGLVCPRRACGGKFIVNLEGIVEQREKEELRNIKTISCPYCFKVSLIPTSEDVEAG